MPKNSIFPPMTVNAIKMKQQEFDAMKKLAVYALEQAPAIILPTPYNYAAWWPWVQNYYGETRAGGHRAAPILGRLWIDSDMKKKMGYTH